MQKVTIADVNSYDLGTIKDSLKKMFLDLGYPEKNPLGEIIEPGNTVFIKPNWVASRWRASCDHVDDLYSVITHPSLLEALADFVAEALGDEGKIIIADNPSIDADFNELMDYTQIKERLHGKYGCELEIKDLRPLVCDDLKNYGKKYLMVSQGGDDQGTIEVNLGKDSLLYGLDPQRFRGVFDERDETIASHTGETQLYTFARSLYDADVYISVPKLKTHQKVGVTLNLKGLVGAITNKNQLVHWQIGYPEIHGDEYPNKEAYDASKKAKVTHRGSWPGNDTIWRMVVDLYKGFKMKEKKYFTVVDGVCGGQGQGPFCPYSKNSNTLIAGEDLFAVDCVATRYMGINPEKIKYLNYFLSIGYDGITLDNIDVILNGNKINDFFNSDSKYLDFNVVDQWKEIKI